jgi:hypothetical protein
MSHFVRNFVSFHTLTAKPAKIFEYPLQREVTTSLEMKVHVCFTQMTCVTVPNNSCQITVTQKIKEGLKYLFLNNQPDALIIQTAFHPDSAWKQSSKPA